MTFQSPRPTVLPKSGGTSGANNGSVSAGPNWSAKEAVPILEGRPMQPVVHEGMTQCVADKSSLNLPLCLKDACWVARNPLCLLTSAFHASGEVCRRGVKASVLKIARGRLNRRTLSEEQVSVLVVWVVGG